MEFCKVTLTFESADQILWYDHSNERSLTVLTHGAICFSKFYWMEFANLLEIYLWLHLAVKGLMVCDHKPAIIFFGFIALKTEILTFAIVLAETFVNRYSFRCLLAKKYLFPVSLTTLQYDWKCNSNYHISSGSSGLITAKLSYLQFSVGFYSSTEFHSP